MEDVESGKGRTCREGRRAGGAAAARILWAAGGFAAFGVGALGTVLPVLPTTPFLLVAAFCFARSSERSRAWFRSTKLYRAVLAGYASKRTMTVKAKLALLVPVTAVLAVSFALMGSVPAGRVVVALVWAGHLVYFGLVVKTDRGPSEGALAAEASSARQAGGVLPDARSTAGAVSPPRVEDARGAHAVLLRAPLGADGEGA